MMNVKKVYISSADAGLEPHIQSMRDGMTHHLHTHGMQVISAPKPEEQEDVLRQMKELSDHADGYVFLGKPDVTSLYFLHYQLEQARPKLPDGMFKTADGDVIRDGESVVQKPIILINPQGEFDPFLRRVEELIENKSLTVDILNDGTLNVVKTPEEAEALLKDPARFKRTSLFVPNEQANEEVQGTLAPSDRPTVFVGCGFTTEGAYSQGVAKRTAELLAGEFNIMMGGGRGGLLKDFQKAAYDAGGHVTGVTFEALNPLAKKPDIGSKTFGLSTITKAVNTADRIEKMIKPSEHILILPGGLGTDTECLAPFAMQEMTDTIHQRQPVIIQNLINPSLGKRCHDGLIAEIKELGLKEGKDFIVINPPLLDHHNHEVIYEPGQKIPEGSVDLNASIEKAAQLTVAALKVQKRQSTTQL